MNTNGSEYTDEEKRIAASIWMRRALDAETKMAKLQSFVAVVREHVVGECAGLLPSDCLEQIEMELAHLDAAMAPQSGDPK